VVRDADVIVVGAGCTGTAAAWQLASRGADVLVLDRAERAGDGGTVVFQAAEGELAQHYGALQSLGLWRELEAVTGTPLLTLTGGVTHGDTDEVDLLAWVADAAGGAGRWLAPGEASERWPGIRYASKVFFHPLAGQLDTGAAAGALRSAARGQGAAVHESEAVSAVGIRRDGDVEVRTASRTYRARRVVIAAGAASAELAGGLVPLPPLCPTWEETVGFGEVGEESGWPVFRHLLSDTERAIDGYPADAWGTPMANAVSVGFAVADVDAAGRLRRRSALCRYVRDNLPGLDPRPVSAVNRQFTAAREPVLRQAGPVVVAAGFSGGRFGLLPGVGRAIAELSTMGNQRPTGLAA
jgi:sarcosine oxidase